MFVEIFIFYTKVFIIVFFFFLDKNIIVVIVVKFSIVVMEACNTRLI